MGFDAPPAMINNPGNGVESLYYAGRWAPAPYGPWGGQLSYLPPGCRLKTLNHDKSEARPE